MFPQSQGLRERFRRSPFTIGLITINLVTWLSVFFMQQNIWSRLMLSDVMAAPWTLLTYPLYSPTSPLSLLLTCYVLYWIGTSLESAWGTRKLAWVTAALTVISGISLNLAPRLVGLPGMPLAGLEEPLTGLFIMWAMMNPSAVILFMFVLPIQARILGYASLVLLYFSTGPLLGLFALVAPLLGWYYVHRTQYAPARARTKPGKGGKRNPLTSFFRRKPRKHLRALDGGRQSDDAPTLKPLRFQPSMSELEVDRILEKIQKEGMSALTPTEKAMLESHSRKLRDA